MSHEATCWAVKQRGLSCAAKVVLWHLADRFHPDNGCFPQQARLAADCEMSRSSLNVQLDALEKAGLIRREQRHDEGTKQRLPTRYRLGFEAGFKPLKCVAASVDKPVENMCETSPDGAESHVQILDMDPAEPCPENGESHVQLNGHGYKAEPVSEPVRDERECADAHGQAGRQAQVQASMQADAGAVSADEGEPTIEAFRSVYPLAGHEAQTRLIAAWDALPVTSQAAALAAVPAFVEAGKAGGRKYLPKGAEYLEHRLWTVAEVRAVQARSTGKATAKGGASAEFVSVERLKRDWWGVMFARLAEGKRAQWGLPSVTVSAGDPALGLGERLRQFPSDGEVAKAWVHWLRAYGFTAPWGRTEQVWLWLPGEAAGDLSGLKNAATANGGARGE